MPPWRIRGHPKRSRPVRSLRVPSLRALLRRYGPAGNIRPAPWHNPPMAPGPGIPLHLPARNLPTAQARNLPTALAHSRPRAPAYNLLTALPCRPTAPARRFLRAPTSRRLPGPAVHCLPRTMATAMRRRGEHSTIVAVLSPAGLRLAPFPRTPGFLPPRSPRVSAPPARVRRRRRQRPRRAFPALPTTRRANWPGASLWSRSFSHDRQRAAVLRRPKRRQRAFRPQQASFADYSLRRGR